MTGRICEADGNKAAGRADALIKTTGNKVGKLVADRNRGSCCSFFFNPGKSSVLRGRSWSSSIYVILHVYEGHFSGGRMTSDINVQMIKQSKVLNYVYVSHILISNIINYGMWRDSRCMLESQPVTVQLYMNLTGEWLWNVLLRSPHHQHQHHPHCFFLRGLLLVSFMSKGRALWFWQHVQQLGIWIVSTSAVVLKMSSMI